MKNPILWPAQIRRNLLALWIAVALSFCLVLDHAAAQSPVTDGIWTTLSYTMPINPIHCGLMHTGKVVVVAGSENDPDEQEYRAAVWDPGTGTIVVQDLLWDVFCNGMAALPDGRWVVVGGNEQVRPISR